MAYGPGVNEINYTDLPPTGDTIASAAQKTQNQFDALYTGLNADIVRATAAEVNTAEDTTKIVTPGTLLKGKASGVASLNESGKVTETELPNASETVKGVIELATDAEVITGTDTERAVTPAGFKAAFGEFYPTGVTPTYVDANTFTVAGDLTAIFTQGRVLKITDTGGTFNAVCSASVYDAGTELTTVTVAGDTIDSGISAVLYAVQQATGQIWESGSNANGEYVRFADGTQICWREVSIPKSATQAVENIQHSAVFTSTPILLSEAPAFSHSNSIPPSDIIQVGVSPSGGVNALVSFAVTAWREDANGTKTTLSVDAYLMIFAIGRWY